MPQINFRYILNELKAKASVLSGTGAPASSPIYAVANAPAGKTLYEQTDTDPRKLWFKSSEGTWLEVGSGGGGAGGSDWGGEWNMEPSLTPELYPLDWSPAEAAAAGGAIPLPMTNAYQTGTMTLVSAVASGSGRDSIAAPTNLLAGTGQKVDLTTGVTELTINIDSFPSLTGGAAKKASMMLRLMNTSVQPRAGVSIGCAGDGTFEFLAIYSAANVHVEDTGLATPVTSAKMVFNAEDSTVTYFRNGENIGSQAYVPALYYATMWGHEGQMLEAADAGKTMVASFTVATQGAVELPAGAAEGKEFLVSAGGSWNGVSAEQGDVVQFVNGTTDIVVTSAIKPKAFRWNIPSSMTAVPAILADSYQASVSGTGVGPLTLTATAQTGAIISLAGIPGPTGGSDEAGDSMVAGFTWPDLSGTNIQEIGFLLYNSAATINDMMADIGMEAGTPAVPVYGAMVSLGADGVSYNYQTASYSGGASGGGGLFGGAVSTGTQIRLRYGSKSGELEINTTAGGNIIGTTLSSIPSDQTLQLAIFVMHDSGSITTVPVTATFNAAYSTYSGFNTQLAQLPAEAKAGNFVHVTAAGTYMGVEYPEDALLVIDDASGNVTHLNPPPVVPASFQWLEMTHVPFNTDGNDGDVAYVEAEGRLYGPKVSGTWGGSDPEMANTPFTGPIGATTVPAFNQNVIGYQGDDHQYPVDVRIAGGAKIVSFSGTDQITFGLDTSTFVPFMQQFSAMVEVSTGVVVNIAGAVYTSVIARDQLAGTEWLFLQNPMTRETIIANSAGEVFVGNDGAPAGNKSRFTMNNLWSSTPLEWVWMPNGNSVSKRFPDHEGFYSQIRDFKQIEEPKVDADWYDLVRINDWTGTARYRREGKHVFVEIQATDGTAIDVLTFPPGVRPTSTKRISGTALADGGGYSLLNMTLNHATGVLSLNNPSSVSADYSIYAEFSFALEAQ